MSAALRCDSGTDPNPCSCEWCKRYGKQSASNNARPLICNSGEFGDTFLVITGRCTRCHYALGDRAYMVRERIVGQIRYHPSSGQGYFLYDLRNVPVCDVCVTDKELDRVSHEQKCGGCGRRLSVLRQPVSRLASLNGDQRLARAECSDACFRRMLHKADPHQGSNLHRLQRGIRERQEGRQILFRRM
jgi:hypothetical protein